MLPGIDNYFVLEKIFGTSNIFDNSEIILLNIFWNEGEVKLEIRTTCAIIEPPKRWKANYTKWAYVYITLHGVNCISMSLRANIEDKPLKIIQGKVEPLGSVSMLELMCDNNQYFKCNFLIGRVQNTSYCPHGLG